MLRLLVLIIAFSATATASAQDWPAKPVRIVVPVPPGGSADLLPRIVGEKLAGKFGQPVIVENAPERRATLERAPCSRPIRTAIPCSPRRRRRW